jgi:hypothetical protein
MPEQLLDEVAKRFLFVFLIGASRNGGTEETLVPLVVPDWSPVKTKQAGPIRSPSPRAST